MGKITAEKWGYQYISKNGNTYVIGQVMDDYWIIVDQFDDVSEMFDGNVLIEDKPITYVYGESPEDIEDFVEDYIDNYEAHTRRVNFWRNIIGKDDIKYSCYLGTENKRTYEKSENVSFAEMMQMANEDR